VEGKKHSWTRSWRAQKRTGRIHQDDERHYYRGNWPKDAGRKSWGRRRSGFSDSENWEEETNDCGKKGVKGVVKGHGIREQVHACRRNGL